MTIKKTYQELVSFLEQNKNKKVETILDEIRAMTSSKQNSKNFIVDESGQVTHVFCYYHKLWEPVDLVPYGSKKNSATGLNSMCKEGVNNWTKQQREYKQNRANLLTLVSAGEISVDQIADKEKEYKEEKNKIIPRSDNIGYKSLEEIE